MFGLNGSTQYIIEVSSFYDCTTKISKLLIRLFWSRFHTPILSAAAIRVAL